MAEHRTLSPLVRNGLELGPILAFFAAYILLKDQSFTISGKSYDGFIVVTAAFIPLVLLSTGVLWWLTGTLNRMQVFTAVLVTLFGGLTVWLNDGSFFKMKPTILYLMFAAILGAGLLQGKSYLQSLMGTMLPITDAGWRALTGRMALFFLVLALANEAIWRTQSTETWVYFKTFGLTAALFAFFMAQVPLLNRHALNEEDPSA